MWRRIIARNPGSVLSRIRDPFGQALEVLRQSVADGRHAPGRPIVIADEARALHLSTTPVREALCWLGGEGLVERGGAGGFLALRLDATSLAQRYGFRRLCLLEMTARDPGEPPHGLISATTPAQRLADLWRWRVRSIGDIALYEAFASVQGRLVRFAGAEAGLFSDLDAEAERMMGANPDEAAGLIGVYHDRRSAAAALLVLNAETEAASQTGAEL